MVGLTADGPTVGSNEGRLTLNAMVSLSAFCASAPPPPNRSSERMPAPPSASACLRFTLNILVLPKSDPPRLNTARRDFRCRAPPLAEPAPLAAHSDYSMQIHRYFDTTPERVKLVQASIYGN